MLSKEKLIRLWHIKYNEILIQRVPLWVENCFVLIFAVPLSPPPPTHTHRRTRGIGVFFSAEAMFVSIELMSHLNRGFYKESIHCG